MTDLRKTDPMFNKYFQDRRIRRYLITAGLINRHGDILPPSLDQIALARRVTQQTIDNYVTQEEQSHHVVKRSHVEKTKNSRQSRRGVSRSLTGIHRLRSPVNTNRKRSPKRTKSAYYLSEDSIKHSARRAKSSTKDRRRVTMIYYGPRTNFDYDNCWFKPDGDEILVLQQHCGGENLTVFKGHLKPNQTFTFESRRHPDYPFALALYVNGFINSRISVCCEHKHKPNKPLDGKHGLFGIYDVKNIKPCLSCWEERRKKKAYANAKLRSEPSRHQKSIEHRSSSRDRSPSPDTQQTPSPSDGSSTPKHRSPDIPRTPTPPRHKEKEKKPANRSHIPRSPPQEEEKKPPILSMRNLPVDSIDYNSNAHHSVALSNNDGESYSSDFEASNDAPASNTRFGRPRISDSHSIDRDQRGSNNSSGASKNVDSSDDEETDRPPETPTGKNDTFSHPRKLPSNTQRKSDTSEDENDRYIPKISTERNNMADRSRSSLSDISRRSDLSSKQELNKKNNNQVFSTTTSKNDIKDRESLSNSVDRKSEESYHLLKKDPEVRRTSTSSSEDIFGDKHSLSKENKKNTQTLSDIWNETNTKTNPGDTNLNARHRTRSWLDDTGSDQDD